MVTETTGRSSTPSEHFDAVYVEGTPLWEIGRPQREFKALAEAGMIRGRVLDVGCGTGANALYLAARGHDVCGIDVSRVAIERAQEKATDLGLRAAFTVGDAMALDRIYERRFDTVIDCGLFHLISEEEREVYLRSVHRVLNESGAYAVLLLSDRNSAGLWPCGLTEHHTRSVFGAGWRVEFVRDVEIETTDESRRERGPAHAWLAYAIAHQ